MIPLLLLLAVAGLMHAARSFSADTTLAGTELAFGFLLLAAYFTAKIFNRFGLPKLTGYLAAGVITGPYVLALVTKDMGLSLKVVSSTATAILALEAGSELNLKKMRPVMRTLRAIIVFAVIGAMLAIAGVLFLMRPILPFFNGLDTTQCLAVCFVIGVAPVILRGMLLKSGEAGKKAGVDFAAGGH